MIRVVMSSMHVYWMALAPIPISILDRLRKLIFAFLWGSSEDKNKYHLMDWQLLSKPKDSGGWGIKNLAWFNISLRLKSLWMVLHGSGIWHQVIIAKYLKNGSVVSWLREKNSL